MNGISAQTPNVMVPRAATAAQAVPQQASQTELDAQPASSVPAQGVKVSISDLAQKKLADDRNSNPNRDIEESGLPDQAQKILKMIRELKQQIQEKQQQIQKIMADRSKSAEDKDSEVGALRSEIATLNASIVTANNSLKELSSNGTLSATQAKQAAQLIMS